MTSVCVLQDLPELIRWRVFHYIGYKGLKKLLRIFPDLVEIIKDADAGKLGLNSTDYKECLYCNDHIVAFRYTYHMKQCSNKNIICPCCYKFYGRAYIVMREHRESCSSLKLLSPGEGLTDRQMMKIIRNRRWKSCHRHGVNRGEDIIEMEQDRREVFAREKKYHNEQMEYYKIREKRYEQEQKEMEKRKDAGLYLNSNFWHGRKPSYPTKYKYKFPAHLDPDNLPPIAEYAIPPKLIDKKNIRKNK